MRTRQVQNPPAHLTPTVRTVPYDLLKEVAIALVACLVLVIVLAAALSSPDVPSVTIQSWAQADPVDFTTTAANELAGQSLSAGYGAPYNTTDAGQTLGPIAPSKWAGVRQPVDNAKDFVISPLQHASVGDSQLTSALSAFQGVPDSQKTTWLTAYTKALGAAKLQDGKVVVASGDYGAVPLLMDRLLTVARSGGLDGLLLSSGHFYQTDFTKPLLFMGEEYAASTPFLYFADHDDPVMAKAVSAGRKNDFAAFGFAEQQVPDPEARETFDRSKLNWQELNKGSHKEMLEWCRALIHLRRRSISLNDGDRGHMKVRCSEQDRWLVMDRGGVQVLVNLGQQDASFDVPEGFRVALASRADVSSNAGKIALPPSTLAILSCEPE